MGVRSGSFVHVGQGLYRHDGQAPQPSRGCPREALTRMRVGPGSAPKNRVALQFDGAHHLDELQKISDRRRDKAFEAASWTVLIFTREDYADGLANPYRDVPQPPAKTRRSPTRWGSVLKNTPEGEGASRARRG